MQSSGQESFSQNNSILGGFYECTNQDCRFRFPEMGNERSYNFCPKCGEVCIRTSFVLFNSSHPIKNASQGLFVALLDNVRSIYNVGSILRTCEGLGITQVYLCGITPIPDNPQMKKTSLGAEHNILWEYSNNSLVMLELLRNRGFYIVGLENEKGAIPIHEFLIAQKPTCLVIGNEQLGIDPYVLKNCDSVISIPMCGEKESFNVSVAFGIAAYQIISNLKPN